MNRPVPGEGLPEGWSPEHWLVFCMIDEGSTIREAALAVGKAPSTIQRWVRGWRDKWGNDVLVSKNESGGIDDEARARSAESGSAVIAAKWEEHRDEIRDEIGRAAGMATALAVAGIGHMAANPERIAELGPQDILALVRSADYLAERADKIAGYAADRKQASGRMDASLKATVDLSGLEQSAMGDGYTEVLASAELVWQEFTEEVLEVGEIDGSD